MGLSERQKQLLKSEWKKKEAAITIMVMMVGQAQAARLSAEDPTAAINLVAKCTGISQCVLSLDAAGFITLTLHVTGIDK